MYVLDTTFLISLHAKQNAAIDLLQSLRNEHLLVPDIVAAEFLTGWRSPDDRDSVLASLEEDFTVVHGNRDWVLTATALRADLRKRDRLIRHADLWIAAWSTLRDAPVITRNAKHFKAMGVETLTW